MKNLQNFGVKELSIKEAVITEGGGEWYSGGCSNGGGTQWEGPASDGGSLQDTINQMLLLQASDNSYVC